MANDATETVIAANGKVSLAPEGTALPTSATAALDAAFKELGYTSDSGVSFTPSITTDGLMAWQSLQPIRTFVSEYLVEAGFELMQWNETNLELYFGGGVFTDNLDGTWDFKLPKPGEHKTYALVIDGEDAETGVYRIVLDKVNLTNAGETSFVRSDGAKLPVTVQALAGTDEGRPGAIYGDTNVTP